MQIEWKFERPVFWGSLLGPPGTVSCSSLRPVVGGLEGGDCTTGVEVVGGEEVVGLGGGEEVVGLGGGDDVVGLGGGDDVVGLGGGVEVVGLGGGELVVVAAQETKLSQSEQCIILKVAHVEVAQIQVASIPTYTE